MAQLLDLVWCPFLEWRAAIAVQVAALVSEDVPSARNNLIVTGIVLTGRKMWRVSSAIFCSG